MNKASQLNTITTVPHEVWLDIFLFCDTRTLCSLGLACKKFNKVFQDDWIWREKIRIEYPTKNDTYNQEFQIPIYHPAYVTFRSRWATATIDSKNAKHFEGICTICKKTDYRMKREELAKYQIPIWRCSACRGKAKELTKLQYYITKQERDMLSTFGTPPVVDSVELSMFETLVVLPSNSMRLRERIILAKQEKKLKKKSNSLLELKEKYKTLLVEKFKITEEEIESLICVPHHHRAVNEELLVALAKSCFLFKKKFGTWPNKSIIYRIYYHDGKLMQVFNTNAYDISENPIQRRKISIPTEWTRAKGMYGYQTVKDRATYVSELFQSLGYNPSFLKCSSVIKAIRNEMNIGEAVEALIGSNFDVMEQLTPTEKLRVFERLTLVLDEDANEYISEIKIAEDKDLLRVVHTCVEEINSITESNLAELIANQIAFDEFVQLDVKKFDLDGPDSSKALKKILLEGGSELQVKAVATRTTKTVKRAKKRKNESDDEEYQPRKRRKKISREKSDEESD